MGNFLSWLWEMQGERGQGMPFRLDYRPLERTSGRQSSTGRTLSVAGLVRLAGVGPERLEIGKQFPRPNPLIPQGGAGPFLSALLGP